MNRIIKLVSKEYLQVNEAAIVLAVLAFASQILGLLRDRSLAAIIGPSPTLDIYYAAFRIPDFLYLSIASLASITVLLPFLVERLKGDNTAEAHARTREFFSAVLWAFIAVLIVISVILFLVMPWLSHLLVPGFSAAETARFVSVSRIMLCSPILLGVSNMMGSITQLYRKFFIYALSPLLYNLGIIIGIFFFYPLFGASGLAMGVILGGMLHLSIQIPSIIKHGFFPKLLPKINWKEIKDVALLSLPRTIGLSMGSLTTLIFIALISKLQSGSISIYNFAYNLQSVPITIVGISYAVAAFPTLVSSFHKGDADNYRNQIFKTGRTILFWTMPITVIFIVLRAQIVRVVLGGGVFSWNDTRLTAASLALLSLGIVAQSLIHLYIRSYYAAGNTKKPLIINAATEVLTIGGAIFLYHYFQVHPGALNVLDGIFRVQNIPDTILLAFPLSYAVFGGIFNLILLMAMFIRDHARNVSSGFWPALLRDTISSLALGVVSYFGLQFAAPFFNENRFLGVLLQGGVAAIFGIVAWMIMNELMRDSEYKNFKHALRRKIWKADIVVPEQAEL